MTSYGSFVPGSSVAKTAMRSFVPGSSVAKTAVRSFVPGSSVTKTSYRSPCFGSFRVKKSLKSHLSFLPDFSCISSMNLNEKNIFDNPLFFTPQYTG
jgi:hypothetical protein